MDDRRIARALAGAEGTDAEERARRRGARWRVVFRVVGVICFVAGAVLAGLLLRPLPRQAELQYTQGKVRQAGWVGTRWPRFAIALDHETRVFVIDDDLIERGGRELSEVVEPGVTARVGFTGKKSLLGDDQRQRAWDLAVDGRAIYSLADVSERAARSAPPWWLAALSLLAAGVILWFLTPRPRRARGHRRRQH
jgi:hypothetical protein